MALITYLTLKGQKQGWIKGDVIQKGKEHQIAVYGVNHAIVSPRDPITGLATGKRQHKPLIITKEIDRSTPLLNTSLSTNEVMTEFTLRFSAPRKLGTTGGSGDEVQHFTIKLTGASIASIELAMANIKIADNAGLPIMETIAFSYQSIERIWSQGNIISIDTWV